MVEGTKDEQRDKYWSELSAEEKVERTRIVLKEVVENYSRRIEILQNQLFKLRASHESHKHVDGIVVLPIQSLGAGEGGDAKRIPGSGPVGPMKVYF